MVFFGVKFTRDYRNVAIILNIIWGSHAKVEKTEFFIVFSTFDSDPEIIM